MQPSSLIFLVIIAIWAAYFLQHWIRRREHLATARSMDRFSESMRVLERRSPLPVADLSAPQPRSYAVSPARPTRPQVTVKRAEAGVDAPQEKAVHQGVPLPLLSVSRQVRGLTLLGSLALLVLALALAAFSVLPWLVTLAPVLLVGAGFAWVRQGVRAERASRRVERRVAGRVARRKPERASMASGARPPRPALAELESHAPQPVNPAEPHVDEEIFDVIAASAAKPSTVADAVAEPALPSAPLVDEDDIPLTWDPVPVPRPTYTMKAKAERPSPPPAEVTATPHGDHTAYEPQVRVAGA